MKKEKIKGLFGTFVLHLVLVLLLLFLVIQAPQKQEEGGVPVMLGNTDMAQGNDEPYTMTDVDITDEPLANETPQQNIPSPEEKIITQDIEKSLEVKKSTNKEEKVRKDNVKPEATPQKPKEKSEAEKRIEARKKAEAEKRAQEERAAKQAAANIAGAFGKGNSMGSKGVSNSGNGVEGSVAGNSTTGKKSGVGGYGTFDLNGRSLGSAGLPNPVYNVQDEGRVVVTIIVNPAGQVISTSINKRTNTVNSSLRKAAEEAARKARFNRVDGTNNQSGTITYYFKLR